jgi:adenylate cyclase
LAGVIAIAYAGRIHVTEEIHAKLQREFVFEERGTIDIRGRGLMKTYFLKAISSRPD